MFICILTIYLPGYLMEIFTHLKLCLADAIHNFKLSENYSDLTQWKLPIF